MQLADKRYRSGYATLTTPLPPFTDEIHAFHDHLNEQNTDIQFTKEIEENGKLPFLDCLVTLFAICGRRQTVLFFVMYYL